MVVARFAEAMAVLFSPVHRLTLEWARRRVESVTRRAATDATAQQGERPARYQEPPIVYQNGRAKGWVTKVRPSLGILPTVIGIDLLNGIRAGIFLAAYVVLEWVSFIHEYKGVPITPWNPGLGAVFALMLSSGARYGVVLFVGVIVAEIAVLDSSLSWPIILAIATIFALGYAAVAATARRALAFDAGLNRLRDVVVLLGGAGIGAAVVALLVSLLMVADAE